MASYFIASIFSLLIVKHPTLKHANVDKSYHRTWGPRLARWSSQALLTLREDRQNRWFTIIFQDSISLWFSLTYRRTRNASETLGARLPRVSLGTYWPCLSNETLQTRSALKPDGAQCDHLRLRLFRVSYFSFSPLLLSNLLFLPCLVFPSDPEGHNFENLSVWIHHMGAAMHTCRKKTLK